VVRYGSRAHLGGEAHAAFWRAVEAGPDWGAVLERAAQHRVRPTLYAHLKGTGALPPDALGRLGDTGRAWAATALFLSAEMAEVAGLLRQQAVPFLVLKGPSLADAYGGAALRPFVDNDVLVRPGDFGRVAEALAGAGFWSPPASTLRLRGLLWVYGERPFGRVRGGRGSTVDVHTRLVPLAYGAGPPFETLRARARGVRVAGAEVPALAWEDLLVLLAVNALKDQWDRLRLAADVAEVARLVGDWDVVEERARRAGAARALRLALLVAAAEVAAEVPDAVLARARSDRRAARLAADVGEHLARADRRGVRSRARLTLLAPDGFRGQARYLGYVALRRLAGPLLTPSGEPPHPDRAALANRRG
jgi:hypothetical protein